MRLILSAVACGSVLAGCTWPDYGNGGADEIYHYERTERVSVAEDDLPSRELRLARSLDRLRKDLDAAWLGLPGKHRPAGMTTIEHLWIRAAREFAGGMYDDAEANLLILRKQVRVLRAELKRSLAKEVTSQPASI